MPESARWVSSDGVRIDCVRFGRGGRPLVYVPSSHGDRHEFAAYRLDETCREPLRRGELQVVSIDGHGPNTFWNDGLDARGRIRAYARFERALRDEWLPETLARLGHRRAIVVGCSYGAHVAANLWLRRPERVLRVCALGGVFGLRHRLGGHHDLDVREHTPLEYASDLPEPALALLRAGAGIDLFAAEDDEWLASSERFRDVLAAAEIPHRFHRWDSPADHHERWWREQFAAWFRETGPSIRA